MPLASLPAAFLSVVLSAATSPDAPPSHDQELLKKRYDAFVASLDRNRVARDYPGAVRKLDSLDPKTRALGIKILGATEELEAIPWIAPFADSKNRQVRVRAGLSLEEIVTSHELKRRDMTRPEKVVIKPPGPGDRDLSPVAWVILRMLRAADPSVRSYAATMAGYLKLSQFDGELRQMLKSRHPAETHAAATALDMLGLDRTLQAKPPVGKG